MTSPRGSGAAFDGGRVVVRPVAAGAASPARFAMGTALLASALSVVGCGSSDSGKGALGGGSTTYPAYTPPPPQLGLRGGPILKAPRIVPVFYPDDADRPAIDAFVRDPAFLGYLHDATSEYGVGEYSAGEAIVLPNTSPSSIDSTQIEALAQSMPAADEDTVFSFFFPVTTTITFGNLTFCQVGSAAAYHLSTTRPDGTRVVFAATARCQNVAGLDDIQAQSYFYSHELAEAATDPLTVLGNPGLYGLDGAHYADAVTVSGGVNGGAEENGDLCNWVGLGFPVSQAWTHATAGGYVVSRLWSNASAAAGHDPCYPPVSPYFSSAVMAPDHDTVIGADMKPETVSTVHVARGATRQLSVYMSSDAPSDPWSLKVVDLGAAETSKPSFLTLTLGQTSAVNGDVVSLSIAASSTAPAGESTAVTIASQLQGVVQLTSLLVVVD